jgi:lipoprotein-releasing system permease protein
VPFELFIAVRYLLAKRRQAFISLISLISTLGVTVGVMALILALALMTGLQGELRDRLLGATGHVYVWKTTASGIADYSTEVSKLRSVPGVVGAAPAIDDKALITSDTGSQFISVKGIATDLERSVTDLASGMMDGHLDSVAADATDDLPNVLLGFTLAGSLNVKVGDRVQLVAPHGTLTPMGLVPRARPARVGGIYKLGIHEFDSAYGFVSLAFARRLTGTEGAEMIQVRVANVYDAPAVAARIREQFGEAYVAQDWQELNQPLFSALALEKTAISITIGLIVIVAALNIIASLILLVMEKSRDIAILKTMGASSERVMKIFMLQGLVIGLVGTTLGAAGGLALSWILDRYELIQIPADVYQVSHVPFVVLPGDFAIVIASAILICFLATLYPSRQASRLDPVQALRYE